MNASLLIFTILQENCLYMTGRALQPIVYEHILYSLLQEKLKYDNLLS